MELENGQLSLKKWKSYMGLKGDRENNVVKGLYFDLLSKLIINKMA